VKVRILADKTPTRKPYVKRQSINYAANSDDSETDIRKMGPVNWRKVAQDRDGWRRATRERLSFWDSAATEEEGEKEESNETRITKSLKGTYSTEQNVLQSRERPLQTEAIGQTSLSEIV
jgi:hypothetical protein